MLATLQIWRCELTIRDVHFSRRAQRRIGEDNGSLQHCRHSHGWQKMDMMHGTNSCQAHILQHRLWTRQAKHYWSFVSCSLSLKLFWCLPQTLQLRQTLVAHGLPATFKCHSGPNRCKRKQGTLGGALPARQPRSSPGRSTHRGLSSGQKQMPQGLRPMCFSA